MTDARTALKSLVIYAICIPLALALGYLLANPMDAQGLTLVGVVLLLLCAPLVIHFHYPFMLLAWNMGAVVFFLPGRMSLWMVAILLTYGVAFTHRIMNRNVHFLTVSSVSRPLIFLALVAVATAELRGGFGFRSMGDQAVGGRRYVELLIGILGFFALTTQKIPREKAIRYMTFFFLAGAVKALSVLYGRVPKVFDFIYLFIPATSLNETEFGAATALHALSAGGAAMFGYLLARYGIRRCLTLNRTWLPIVLLGVIIIQIASGARSALLFVGLTFSIQFWLEGLLRTKLAVVLGLFFVLAVAAATPFVTRLPLSFQRTLAVLPIEVDPIAQATADASSEWRRQIWRAVTPQIPQYLLLGKGYSISREDFGFMTDKAFEARTVEERAATIAGDYHNGPLSVVMPFGIWGVIGFTWFLIAGGRVVWCNYRYGDRELQNFNTYLLTSYFVATISFLFVLGSLYSQLMIFTGIVGVSVALNGGVARSVGPEAVSAVRSPSRQGLPIIRRGQSG